MRFWAQSWAHALCCDVRSGQASFLSRVRVPKNYNQGSRLLLDATIPRGHAMFDTFREQRKR